MPIKYAVLIGTVNGGDREDTDPRSPHYTIFVTANQSMFRIPVNVQSTDGSQVLYFHAANFTAPITTQLKTLDHGLHGLRGSGHEMRLDYIRGKYFDPTKMTSLPASRPGSNNDLQDIINGLIERAKAQRSSGAEIYAFGEQFGRSGLHDVHKNQGNGPGHQDEDGVWQDGGLIFFFPLENRFEALFFAFKNQSWDTDDTTGHRNP